MPVTRDRFQSALNTAAIVVATGMVTGTYFLVDEHDTQKAADVLLQQIEAGNLWVTLNGKRIETLPPSALFAPDKKLEIHYISTSGEKSCPLPSTFDLETILAASLHALPGKTPMSERGIAGDCSMTADNLKARLQTESYFQARRGNVKFTINGKPLEEAPSIDFFSDDATIDMRFPTKEGDEHCSVENNHYVRRTMADLRDNAAPYAPTSHFDSLRHICEGEAEKLTPEEKKHLSDFGAWIQEKAHASAQFQPTPYIEPKDVTIVTLAQESGKTR